MTHYSMRYICWRNVWLSYKGTLSDVLRARIRGFYVLVVSGYIFSKIDKETHFSH